VAPIITGIIVHFKFHIHCISVPILLLLLLLLLFFFFFYTSCMVNWSLSQISVEINWTSVPYLLLCIITLVHWCL
jgi:hypothetical protein